MKPPSDYERLADVDPEFARLVSALRTAGPSKDAMERTLGAVAGVASEPAGLGQRSRSEPQPASPKSTSLVKWVGVGVAVLALSAAGRAWMQSDDGSGAKTPSTSNVVAAGTEHTAGPTVSTVDVPTSTVRVEDLPTAQVPPPSVAARPPAPAKAQRSFERDAVPTSTPAPSAPDGTSLETKPGTTESGSRDAFREELALVERIRMQLSRGETDACLRSIDLYNERFRGGAFVQEVEVMRVEALANSGDRARARGFGERFFAEHPKSPYVERVRSVLEKTK
jgi:hypothetical protein